MAGALTIEKLSQSILFNGLSEAEARAIVSVGEERPFRSGETLFNEGDAGTSLLLILEGELEIRMRDKQGGTQRIATVAEGGVVGEMSLLGERPARAASAIGLRDGTVLQVPSERFSALLNGGNVPELRAAVKVARNLATVLSKRLLKMDEQVVEMMGGGRKAALSDFQKILTQWSF
jgi:CRP-like cAMP-binding protein